MPPTRDDILEAIRQVYDPEIPVSIVDLGLIYEVEVHGDEVRVVMTLTNPGCGLSPFIAREVEARVEEVEGVGAVHVEITFDPPWTPARMSEDAALLLDIQRDCSQA